MESRGGWNARTRGASVRLRSAPAATLAAMSRPLDGKAVIVTGGNSGIGRATALRFARAGASVVVAARRADACDAVVTEIRQAGGVAISAPTDVTNEDSIQSMVDATVRTFGGLHAAFNNAGCGGPARLHECSNDLWDRIHATNLRGVFHCMKYQLRAMLAGGGGSIVNNSSAAGLVGHGIAPAYASSKHAVIGLTKSAALQYCRDNIRINAVCPGVIGTPLVQRAAEGVPGGADWFLSLQPGGRAGEPRDVADLVVFLCSDEARFITGAALPVDGGMIAGFVGPDVRSAPTARPS
jgi:NAD(P)-dependent dehydrogenase (short-subunit alcohol dehydrogenase family)